MIGARRVVALTRAASTWLADVHPVTRFERIWVATWVFIIAVAIAVEIVLNGHL